MNTLVLEARGMPFDYRDSEESKVSDLRNFRHYANIVVDKGYMLCDSYDVEISTHKRETQGDRVKTWVDVSKYNSEKGLECRVQEMCFYCKPTQKALLSKINKVFGTHYKEIKFI